MIVVVAIKIGVQLVKLFRGIQICKDKQPFNIERFTDSIFYYRIRLKRKKLTVPIVTKLLLLLKLSSNIRTLIPTKVDNLIVHNQKKF